MFDSVELQKETFLKKSNPFHVEMLGEGILYCEEKPGYYLFHIYLYDKMVKTSSGFLAEFFQKLGLNWSIVTKNDSNYLDLGNGTSVYFEPTSRYGVCSVTVEKEKTWTLRMPWL